ncbi:DUF3606 domain-containing protein [Hymenobacter jeongseonensis]
MKDKRNRQYWCQAFCCTRPQLRDAVAAVGPKAEDVRRYLRGEMPDNQ